MSLQIQNDERDSLINNDCLDSRSNYGSNLSHVSSETDFHCHSLTVYENNTNKRAQKVLIISLFICTTFMVIEVVGGILAQSLAIVTDAAHLLTDVASMLISLFSIYVATRPKSKKMSFGWHRAEVIGAFVSVFMIWIVTAILVYLAIQRIITHEYEVDGKIMSITAGIGVLVNILMGEASHVHEDSLDSHSHNKSNQNINVRAAFVHVIGDLIQSIGVLVAALIILYNPEWAIMDPICTLFFSFIVLCTTLYITKDALVVLLEGIPSQIDFSVVLNDLGSIIGVVKVHDLRIWSLTMDKIAISVHLEVEDHADQQEILKQTTILLKKKYNAVECTVQIEKYQVNSVDCLRCVTP
ncbi:Cation efflux protein family and Cation efflux protein transmembrane domain-containing protein [Strongyloides ratti]|uniref:Cation efflux protein family and Cation efflux protein transmembrane domain-containing protein n=1 Tax=Strongyloides ratti TaxID=34506 RepID=A0A090LHX8_STRRB|nr:Cation efflux protein family and Cation efflux protein transmembrane domain-containing protein [Strongyloides ratti]CEF69347.1 Cation efflux protein family and Cation efflux protein transmembrane domain-containing protein [Strongyloides ratti]